MVDMLLIPKVIIMSVAVVAAISAAIVVAYSWSLAISRLETAVNNGKNLPVLLIHGLAEDAAVWHDWEALLTADGVRFYTITFQDSDDKCGDAVSHARELVEIVSTVQRETGSDRVNIVGHSKGGIDGRVYLANGTSDVENLIMIGTPNNGTTLATASNPCAPAIFDVLPGAQATRVEMNIHTRYWTIAGDWMPLTKGNPVIPGNDDGLVSVVSVETEPYFQSLGRTNHHHLELLGEEEYHLARNILLSIPSSTPATS
jgi:pimeloyl-ACP methyl ester carboxylesterase